MRSSSPRNRADHVRDFRRGSLSDDLGDWVVSDSAIFDYDTPPFPLSAWGTFGLGSIPPGTLVTYQAVMLPPTSTPGAPLIGGCLIDEIDCNIFEVPVGQSLAIEGGIILTSPSTTVGTVGLPIPSMVIPGNISLGTPTTVALWGAVLQNTIPAATITMPVSVAMTDAPNFGVCLNSISPLGPVAIGVNLYVSSFNSQTGSWMVYDPLLDSTACRDDMLDIMQDVFLQPAFAFGHTGRRWSVKLPYPIMIGAGQALHVTFSNSINSNTGGILTVAFIRSRVCAVS